jgi:O-antigen/teichoic acid export membrane protein
VSVAVPPAAAAAPAPAARAPRSHLVRNGIALVINSAISSLLGAGYWFVAAHRTDQATVGQATALVASLTALSTISQLSLPGVLASYLPRAGTSARWLVIQAYGVAFSLSIVLGSWFAFLAPLLDDGFAPLRGIGPLLLFTASVAIWSIFALQDNALTGLRMAVWVPLENIVYSAVKLGALIALGAGVGALALLATWVIPAAVALLPVSGILLFRLLPRHAAGAAAEDLGGLRRYFAGDSVGLILSQLSTTLLPVLVVIRLDTEAAGAFGIAWLLAQSLDLVAVNLGMSLTVEGAHDEQRLPELLGSMRVRVLALVTVLAAVGIAIAPLLMGFFGENYADDGTTVLRLLLLGSIGRSVTVLAICAARAGRRPGRIIRLQAGLAFLIPGTAWVLAGPLGLAGVGVAWAAAQAIVAVGAFTTEPFRRRS